MDSSNSSEESFDEIVRKLRAGSNLAAQIKDHGGQSSAVFTREDLEAFRAYVRNCKDVD
tara:strand:+ start:5903 stop:6079 length:177 start_codon:yes stop_codon:yes gene_type:complete